MVEPQPSKLMVRVRFPSSAPKEGAPVFRGSFRILTRTFLSASGLERRGIDDEAVAHFRGHNFVVGLGDGITVKQRARQCPWLAGRGLRKPRGRPVGLQAYWR